MDALHTGLNDPEDVIVRQDGSILIADHLNRRVISIHPDGSAEIFAGQVGPDPDSETEIGLLQH
jgi:hypothetical protein